MLVNAHHRRHLIEARREALRIEYLRDQAAVSYTHLDVYKRQAVELHGRPDKGNWGACRSLLGQSGA